MSVALLNFSWWKRWFPALQFVFSTCVLRSQYVGPFASNIDGIATRSDPKSQSCWLNMHLIEFVYMFFSDLYLHAIKSTCGFYSSTEQISRNPLISLLKRPRRLPGESVTWDAVGRYWFQWGVSFQVGNSWGQSIHKELTIFWGWWV